jgi:phosphohistidine swiveling domain-containing protein
VLSEKDFIYVFERLSAPEKLSFYQTAELELIKLKKFYGNNRLFEKKLAAYQKKYFWILNSYLGTRVLTVEYFRKELLTYSAAKISAKIRELQVLPYKLRREKFQIINKFKLNKNILNISNKLSYCVWWQDSRKYYIFLAHHYIDLFLKEFSRRYQIDFSDLTNYNVRETLDLAKLQRKVSSFEISRRKINSAVYYSQQSNAVYYYSGAKARKIISQYAAPKADKNVKFFKGLVVSRGKIVRGRVRIITSTSEFGKMKKGDILVAAMTSPDYIVAMKKSAAIVTDEGGLTCHAAIVSRELGIPCIVGTKIATRVLKDGDLVEVDANQGIVKKIK